MMKDQVSRQTNIQKVAICPGSANILRNLDNLVDKWSDKIEEVRHYSSKQNRNTNINVKYSSLSSQILSEKKAFKANKLKFKVKKKGKKSKFINAITLLKWEIE